MYTYICMIEVYVSSNDLSTTYRVEYLSEMIRVGISNVGPYYPITSFTLKA